MDAEVGFNNKVTMNNFIEQKMDDDVDTDDEILQNSN